MFLIAKFSACAFSRQESWSMLSQKIKIVVYVNVLVLCKKKFKHCRPSKGWGRRNKFQIVDGCHTGNTILMIIRNTKSRAPLFIRLDGIFLDDPTPNFVPSKLRLRALQLRNTGTSFWSEIVS